MFTALRVPVTEDVPFVPVAVRVCVCVPSADPVKVSAGMVEVAFVGTPTGHAFVPAGVNAAVPFVPVAVSVWVWVARADPVKVSAGMVLVALVGTPAGHEMTCVCVASADPVKVGVCAMALATPPVVLESAPVVRALIVPAGVPAVMAALVGTPAGQDIT